MDSGLAPEQPPSPHRLSLPESSVMKLTRGHSCVLCQQRKVRCDKQKPCANCVKAQVECRVVPPQPPRRRKKKPHERDLIDRLKKYEALLSQHGVSFEPIANDLKPSDAADDVADLEHDLSGLKTSPSSANDPISPDSQDKQNKWFPYYKEYRQHNLLLNQDSSDEDYEGPTIHHAFDSMFDNNDGFPFVVGGSINSVTNSHPSAIQIFQLWQIYINNVNPMLKITHIQTLQSQIISAGANTAKIPRPLEALMFSIYFTAITSMTDQEVQSTFGEDKAVLLNKYHGATQQALVNAGFMRSPDLAVLQALLLYLVGLTINTLCTDYPPNPSQLAARQYVDPRSLFCLIGVAVRVATRLGLHRDGAQFGLPPFETEQRRRLWWQIVIFDKRVAEITGSTITALSSSGGDCRLPSNINDTDLNVHAKDPPAPYQGPTEMLFCLTRIELTIAAAPNGVRPVATTPGGGNKPRVHYSPSPSSPDVVTHVANLHLPTDLEGYCAYIENAYLKQCDPKIPLHFFTLMMTRQNLCKLRVIGFLCKGVPTDSLEPADRDAVLIEAIRMVEYDNIIQGTEALAGFRWYTFMHFPFPAYIFLVSELRERKTGELCERAWVAILENHERRGLIKNLRSPLHIAFGHLLVKAWDAHESAEMQLGRAINTPRLIVLLRQHMTRFRRPSGSGPASAGGPPAGPGVPRDAGVAASPTAVYAGKPMVDAPMHMVGTGPPPMMVDDSMAYPGYDAVNAVHQMFGSPEVDFGQMDWNYLMQYGGFGGGFGGAMFPQPGGQPGPGPH